MQKGRCSTAEPDSSLIKPRANFILVAGWTKRAGNCQLLAVVVGARLNQFFALQPIKLQRTLQLNRHLVDGLDVSGMNDCPLRGVWASLLRSLLKCPGCDARASEVIFQRFPSA